MAGLTIQQKLGWAKTLFLNENLTQKEIAARVGITEKTLSKHVNAEKWDLLKSSFIITKDQELRRIYMQISELNTKIFKRPEGERFANAKEADTLNKLAATARKLETEAAISDIVEVFKRFLTWLRNFDLEKAKELGALQDAFIKDCLK